MIYFGTLGNMTWVNAPAPDVPLALKKWSATGTFLNGGSYVMSSATGHHEYQFNFGAATRDKVYEFIDFAAQPDLIYFLDPFAMDRNVLPEYVAAPFLAANGAPSLVKGVAPGTVASSTVMGYPALAATYTVGGSSVPRTFSVPVPAGYTFHFGVHGTATGTAVVTVNGSAATMLSPTSSVRTNKTVVGPATAVVSVGGSGTLTLAGMIGQVLKTGQTVTSGGFISGRGHSGCRFDPQATLVTGVNAALDLVSASVSLIETGAWE